MRATTRGTFLLPPTKVNYRVPVALMRANMKLKFFYDRCIEEGDCRLWKCGCTGQGSPVISIGGVRGLYVRKLVAEIVLCRKIEQGEYIFPMCRNRKCISEWCLNIGSKSDYMQHAAEAGAYASPETNARRALTAHAHSGHTMEEAREIRRRRFEEGLQLKDISAITGRSIHVVSLICLNKSWRESVRGASVFNQ